MKLSSRIAKNRKGLFDVEDVFFYIGYILFITFILLWLSIFPQCSAVDTSHSFAYEEQQTLEAEAKLNGVLKTRLPAFATIKTLEENNKQFMGTIGVNSCGGNWNDERLDAEAVLSSNEPAYVGKTYAYFMDWMVMEVDAGRISADDAKKTLAYTSAALFSENECSSPDQDNGACSFGGALRIAYAYPRIDIPSRALDNCRHTFDTTLVSNPAVQLISRANGDTLEAQLQIVHNIRPPGFSATP